MLDPDVYMLKSKKKQKKEEMAGIETGVTHKLLNLLNEIQKSEMQPRSILLQPVISILILWSSDKVWHVWLHPPAASK